MATTPIEEYLYKLGAGIDHGSFNQAISCVKELRKLIGSVESVAVPAAFFGGVLGITKATAGIIKSAADAEIQYKRLGTQMWVTAESAKVLSVAMKTMGVSEQDIAWIPELRNQFFRLRSEMTELAAPVDTASQFKWIREISYDIQSLQIRVKMLAEWVAYFLTKYLGPMIAELQRFIQWINAQLGQNMPAIARKIARVLSTIVGIAYSAISLLKSVIGGILDFVGDLPGKVKKWATIFGLVFATISSGPLGHFLIAITAILTLVQDFVYYTNGWNSSKTLAPMWEKVLKFLNSDTLKMLSAVITDLLKIIANILEKMLKTVVGIIKEISESIDWEAVNQEAQKAAEELGKAFWNLNKAAERFFDMLAEKTSWLSMQKHMTFWKVLGGAIKGSITTLAVFVSMFAKLAKALSQVFSGDFKGAANTMHQFSRQATIQRWGIPFMAGIKSAMGDSSLESEYGNFGIGGNFGSVNMGSAVPGAGPLIGMLVQAGLTPAGAAGLVGNLLAESGLDPGNAENSSGVNDAAYVAGVDNGSISEDEFANDGIGFGLAQWTAANRKRALYQYAKSTGRSIADLGMQIEFLLNELKENYSSVYQVLASTDSVREASDTVLHDFESPADQSVAVEEERAANGSEAMASMTSVSNSSGGTMGLVGSGFGDGMHADAFSIPAISSTSYAAAAVADPKWNSSSSSSISFGIIRIDVSGTNATPNEIYEAFKRGLNAKAQREVIG